MAKYQIKLTSNERADLLHALRQQAYHDTCTGRNLRDKLQPGSAYAYEHRARRYDKLAVKIKST